MTEHTDPKRWMRQAEIDLKAAEDNAKAAHYDWACFCCQQAAEKALKAVLYGQGRSTSLTTHSLKDLVKAASRIDASFARLREVAKSLDTHYAQSRYPDAVNGSEIPAEIYEADDFAKARECTHSILTACRNWLGGSSVS